MRAALGVLVIVVGCGKKEPASSGSAAAPVGSGSAMTAGAGSGSAAPVAVAGVRFVAVGNKTARIIEVDATAGKVLATVELPQAPTKVVWGGADPVVMFATSQIPENDDDPKLDGRFGVIKGGRFELLPAFPASTWTIPKPKDAENLGAWWDLQATSTGETWQGRCEWGGIEDGGHCDHWVWARIGGAFPLTTRTAPPEQDKHTWKPAAPAPGFTIKFETKDGSEYDATITCTGGGATLTLPDEEHQPAWDKQSGVQWVSTEPPIFVATQIIEGFVGSLEPAVFEGCTWSKKFDGAKLYAGPDNTLVIANATTMSIWRDGKELASLPGADFVAFGGAEPAASTPFAILERELAGDTKMLDGATVLAPAPTAAAGIDLVPGTIKAARITSYRAHSVGDAHTLAAEIEITGDGASSTYRTVQLIDKAGRVVVASFAPLKPLARVAAAPPMLTPSEAGPLSAFLTSPKAAASAIDDHAVVFGTDANERAMDESDAKQLLGRWGKLSLQLEPAVREVRTGQYGYAIATVNLAKPGGAPYRMTALVVGELADDKSWKVAALHYLPL